MEWNRCQYNGTGFGKSVSPAAQRPSYSRRPILGTAAACDRSVELPQILRNGLAQYRRQQLLRLSRDFAARRFLHKALIDFGRESDSNPPKSTFLTVTRICIDRWLSHR